MYATLLPLLFSFLFLSFLLLPFLLLLLLLLSPEKGKKGKKPPGLTNFHQIRERHSSKLREAGVVE